MYYNVRKKVEQEVADEVRRFINGEIDEEGNAVPEDQQKKLQGVWIQPDTKRYYTYSTLAANVLGFVNASENATRLQYLADFGLTDDDVERMEKKPACRDYTEFLLETAEKEEIPEILMAVMPCMLGYYYVFCQLLRRHPAVMDTYYAPLVRDYTSDQYKASCEAWTDYCNQVCQGLDEQRKQKLDQLFEQASKHELYFWRMAGEQA